jgi:hypothetical protein
VKLAPFLLGGICDSISSEGGGSEDEVKLFNRFQLTRQGFDGVDGKARGCDLQACARLDRLFKVLTPQLIDVVD